MAEYTNSAAQTVNAGGNVLFTETTVCGTQCIVHRAGSGIVTLRGITSQCRARYRVLFGGNIAVPAGGTVAPVSVSISMDGEPLASTTAIETPAATGAYNNVFTAMFVDVPRGCCATIAVQNTSTQAISVQNANLIVERIA